MPRTTNIVFDLVFGFTSVIGGTFGIASIGTDVPSDPGVGAAGTEDGGVTNASGVSSPIATVVSVGVGMAGATGSGAGGGVTGVTGSGIGGTVGILGAAGGTGGAGGVTGSVVVVVVVVVEAGVSGVGESVASTRACGSGKVGGGVEGGLF